MSSDPQKVLASVRRASRVLKKSPLLAGVGRDSVCIGTCGGGRGEDAGR